MSVWRRILLRVVGGLIKPRGVISKGTGAGATGDTTASAGIFPQTLWTMVQEATDASSVKGREALGRLCEMYHAPARWWLLRTGTDPNEVDDLVQAFVMDLWSRDRLRNFQRRPTKFRSFIIECLKNFRTSEWRKKNAKKRPPGEGQAVLEEEDLPSAPDLESGLDLEFAVTAHLRALARVAEGYARRSKLDRFEALRPALLGADDSADYAELGRRLQLTPGAVKKAVFDLRDAYFEAYRSEVLEIATMEAWEEEMRYLVGLLAKADPSVLNGPLPQSRSDQELAR